MICSKRGGEGSKNLLHGWGGAGRAWGGQGVATKTGGGREFCRGEREGGDHSSPRSFSEGVAALRAGLPTKIAFMS